MKTLKDILTESVLDDIETNITKGDELTKFGNYYKLVQLYGDDDALLYINRNKLRDIAANNKAFSDIEEKIEKYDQYSGVYGLSDTKKLLIRNMVIAIENMPIPAVKDFNNHKFKTDALSNITNILHDANVLPASALLHNNTSFGDRKGIFQVILECKGKSFVFVYELK